jgi:phage-related protein
MSQGLKLGSLYVSVEAETTKLVSGFSKALGSVETFAKNARRVSAEVSAASGMLAAFGGVAVAMASQVDGRTKAAVDGLKGSAQLLAVQVADLLIPALRSLSQMAREVANWIAGLNPHTKAAIASFALFAIQAAAVGKSFQIMFTLGGAAVSILKGAMLAVSAVGVGPIVAIAAAIGLAIAAVVLLHRAWRKNWGGIQEATASVIQWMHEAFLGLSKFFQSFWEFFLTGAQSAIEGLLKVVDAVQSVTGTKLVDTNGLRSGFEGLFKDLRSGSMVSDAVKLGKTLGAEIVGGLKEEFQAISKELGLDSLFKSGVARAAGGVGKGPRGPVTSGASSIADNSGINAGAEFLSQVGRDLRVAQEANARDFQLAVAAHRDEVAARRAIADEVRRAEEMLRARATGDVSKLDRPQRAQFENQNAGARAAAVGASDWATAQQSLKEGLKGAWTIGEELGTWASRMAPLIGSMGQQLLGAVGQLVDSIVQGAQAGGVWGAIIAAFMEIASKAKSAMAFLDTAMEFVKQLADMIEPLVAPIFDALTNVLGIVIQIIAPVFKALQPLFEAIGKLVENLSPIIYAIGDVLQALGPIIEFIGKLVGAIVDVLKPVFEIIGGVVKVIATVISGILIFLNEIAAAFGDQKARAESDRMKKMVDQMWQRSAADDIANGKAAGATLRNAAAQDQAAKATQKATESFQNVPSGYKVAYAQFNADQGLFGSAATQGLSGGNGAMVVNGDININTTQDADEALQGIKRAARRDRATRRGNPYGRGLDDGS